MATDRVLEALVAYDVDHQILDCDPDLADTAEFCAHYGYALDQSANAIMVVGKGDPRTYAMCVVLATTQVDVNKVVRKRLGAKKASFAPADETAEITGMVLGGVTPFGLPPELPLWIDARVMDSTQLIVGGGSRDRKVLLPPAGLLQLPGAEVVEDLAKVRPAI